MSTPTLTYLHAVTVTFLLGIWAEEAWKITENFKEGSFDILWWGALANLLLFFLFRNLRGNANLFFIFVAAFLIGIARLYMEYEIANNNPLMPFCGHYISLIGKVKATDSSPYYNSISLKVTSMSVGQKWKKTDSAIQVRCQSNCSNIGNGNTIMVNGILESPKGRRNPGERSQKTILMQKRIYYVIWSKEPPEILEETTPEFPLNGITSLKQEIKSYASETAPKPLDSLLLGITVGERAIPEEIKNIFRDSGTAHILVASGSNAGVIVAVILFFCFIRINGKQYLKILAIVTASFILLIYAGVVGEEPSIWRATIMALAALTAIILKREKDLLSSAAISALALVLYQPLLLFDPGFQFSFLAVLGIIFILPNILPLFVNLPSWIGLPVAVTLAAQLAVAPSAVYYFQYISFIAPLSNIIAVPLASVILVMSLSGFILSYIALPIAAGLSFWNNCLLALLWKWTLLCASIPGASLHIPQPEPSFIIAFYFILLCWTFRHYFKTHYLYRWLFLILAVVLCFRIISLYFFIPLRIFFLDVGQGDSAVIFFPNKEIMLIDGGKMTGDSSIALRFLRRKGVKKINYLILTHPHRDHLEGLLPVINSIKIDSVLDAGIAYDSPAYDLFISKIKQARIPLKIIRGGDFINISSSISMEILWPTEPLINSTNSDINNNSAVVKLKHKNISVLFAGDVEMEAEEYIMALNKQNLRSTILKVPHHGSKNGSPSSFIAAVRPVVSIISVGAYNIYGHPEAITTNTLQKLSNNLYRTDQNGAIVIESDGEHITCHPMTGTAFSY